MHERMILKKYATWSRPSMVWLFVASGQLLLFILLSAPTATLSTSPTAAPTMLNVPSGCDMLYGQTWTTTDSWAMQITFFEGMSSGGLDYGHFSSSYGNGQFYFGAGSTAYCGYARSGYMYLNCYTGTPYSYVAQQYACYYYIYVYNSSLCYGCGAGSTYSSPTRVPTRSPTSPSPSRSPSVTLTHDASSLSSGATAGIALGSILVLGGMAYLVRYLKRPLAANPFEAQMVSIQARQQSSPSIHPSAPPLPSKYIDIPSVDFFAAPEATLPQAVPVGQINTASGYQGYVIVVTDAVQL
jgi:hypothetical protein